MLVVFLQGDSDDDRRDVIDLSDSDDSVDRLVCGLRNHVHCVGCHQPIRRLVFGLPAVRVAPVDPLGVRIPTSHVRLGEIFRVDLDRANRADYMRDWQARAKRQRVETRDLARRNPRRSPRVSSSSV